MKSVIAYLFVLSALVMAPALAQPAPEAAPAPRASFIHRAVLVLTEIEETRQAEAKKKSHRVVREAMSKWKAKQDKRAAAVK